jgi:hypothetical protein
MKELNKTDRICQKIHEIRGVRVIIDRDLADLYGVETRALNQAVKRNINRFPGNFMFQLNDKEKNKLITICDRFRTLKHASINPYAFTEHGALMASTVLNSDQAVRMSVYIIQAFVKFREALSSHGEIIRRLDDLEKNAGVHDEAIREIAAAIRQLMAPEEKTKRKIGF